MNTVLLLGAGGQLGKLVAGIQPGTVTLHSREKAELDITDPRALSATFEKLQPDVVINCAAYTAVDGAESDREAAYNINGRGVENLARLLPQDKKLIHVSTDFVFSKPSSRPYTPDDEVAPVSVYGHSKLAGEQALREFHPGRGIILRTSWLYSARGRNFVTTMLRLMNEKEELNVVDDQFGSPTSAHLLAEVVWKFALKEGGQGIYHWSDQGVISWYDFAAGIYHQARQLGLVEKAVKINPVPTGAYPTAAVRPAYSALDSSKTESFLGITGSPWQDQLNKVLSLIKASL